MSREGAGIGRLAGAGLERRLVRRLVRRLERLAGPTGRIRFCRLDPGASRQSASRL